MQRFSDTEMHELLGEHTLTDRYRHDGWLPTQALHCPYYVPLAGRLGADWGVVVNPESRRFALVTFEHDDCGCSGADDRHRDDPDQDGDMWWSGWSPTPGGRPASPRNP